MSYNNRNNRRNHHKGNRGNNVPYKSGENRAQNKSRAVIREVKAEDSALSIIEESLAIRVTKEDYEYFAKYKNNEIVSFYSLPAVQANPTLQAKLFEILDSKVLAKALKKAAKGGYLTDEWIAISHDFLIRYASKQEWFDRENMNSDKRTACYYDIMRRLGSDLASSVSKRANISEELGMEIITLLPTYPSKREIRYKIYPILNTIEKHMDKHTSMENSPEREHIASMTEKSYRKLWKELFHEDDLPEVALRILLQHKNRIAGNSNVSSATALITQSAVEILERLDTKDLQDILYEYATIRRSEENNRVIPRRTSLSSLKSYPKIQDALDEITEYNQFDVYYK